MRLNTISHAPGAKTAKRRLGRGIGSGLGKTSGKGHKGQHARAGGYNKRGFEGGQMPLQMRVPKFGFKSRTGFVTEEVRLSSLSNFKGEVVTVETLKEANIINNNTKFVKIFLQGEISKPLVFKGVRVSAGARTAIENAGGKIEE